MKNIIPTGHRVVVKLDPIEETSKGGIIITTGDQKDRKARAMEDATVISVGPNAFKDFGDGHVWCEEGDKVIIAQYAGVDRVDEDTKEIYKIINDEDILAKVGE